MSGSMQQRRWISRTEFERRRNYRKTVQRAVIEADGLMMPAKRNSPHWQKWSVDAVTLIIWHWLLTRHATRHPAPFNKTGAGHQRRQERRFKQMQRGMAC